MKYLCTNTLNSCRPRGWHPEAGVLLSHTHYVCTEPCSSVVPPYTVSTGRAETDLSLPYFLVPGLVTNTWTQCDDQTLVNHTKAGRSEKVPLSVVS